MKLLSLTFLFLIAATSPQEKTAPVAVVPPPGGIRLLDGYHHELLHGIDSPVGRIWKEDGLEIHYDIGAMAGNWADSVPEEQQVWDRRQVVAGETARIVERKDGMVVVTFLPPKQEQGSRALQDGPANFYAKVRSRGDLVDLLLTALTYPRAEEE